MAIEEGVEWRIRPSASSLGEERVVFLSRCAGWHKSSNSLEPDPVYKIQSHRQPVAVRRDTKENKVQVGSE